MLPFFTNPYPGELLYSAIARYHYYSGNIDCKDTLEELFGNRSVIPSVEIGSHLNILAERLGHQYTVESLLSNHTIYPYYVPFLSKERQQEILEDVKGNGQALYTRLGLVAGGICRKEGLYYCSQCAIDDVDCYGETYIHREHQLQGINYCPHHELLLREYKSPENSRIEYVRFELKNMNLTDIYLVEEHKDVAIQLSKQAYRLLQLPIHQLSREHLKLKYRKSLREKNLITASNRLRQKDFCKDFQAAYPASFLEHYESSLDVDNEYNWLKVLTRNVQRHVHPFRHLLLMNYLQMEVSNITDYVEDQGPFGKGPFPCLNKVTNHYKKDVISTVKITRDYKSSMPIGTFKCICGFTYVRKGPDKEIEDRYRIGKVTEYGQIWMNVLIDLAKQGLSIRAMARALNVDSKTIKRYLHDPVQVEETKLLLEKEYRKQWIEARKASPQLNRTQLRKAFSNEYMWLYRNDKEWLFNHLPPIQKRTAPLKVVDWKKRDIEYVKLIEAEYQRLYTLEKPIRITMSVIGRRLGIITNIEKHLDKLPKTKELLNSITESTEDFQIRRCKKIIVELIKSDVTVSLWQVQRIANVKSHHFKKIKSELETYLRTFWSDSDEQQRYKT